MARYLIVKKYNLKPLAITLNNYFRTEIADINLKKILEKLDVDHIMVTPRWGIMKRLYKRFLENEGKGKYVLWILYSLQYCNLDHC